MQDPEWDWINFTPRKLATYKLIQCAELLGQAQVCGLHFIAAAKAAHLALQSALTAALAGHGFTGALDERARSRIAAYLADETRDPEGGPTMRVMHFDDLLQAAQGSGLMRGQGERLRLGTDEREALAHLTYIRHSVEHPKPGAVSFSRGHLLRAIKPAARITVWLLRHNDICDLLSESEHEAVRTAAETIERLSNQGLQTGGNSLTRS